jgi:methenyltetrahydrofolate cyclohydrolase
MPEPDQPRSFRDLTIGEFVDELASAAPVPGGGSASAVAASLAAALVSMVAALSRDRPRYAQHVALHEQSAIEGRRYAERLLLLADQDADAYAGYAAAMKLPRETEAEQAARRAAIEAAARVASDVPMETLEMCLGVVSAAESLVGRSNVNASSDLGVAALLGSAAAHGAAANVLVNLPSVGDDGYAGEMTLRVKRVLDNVEELAAIAHEELGRGESREPFPA